MKKIISVLVAGLMVLALVGCGSNNKTENNTKVEEKSKYENYKLGEVGKSGKYQLKTISYSETDNIVGATETYTTANKFIVVDIEIAANDKTEELGYSSDDFILIDKDKKTYSTSNISIDLNVVNRDNGYIRAHDSLNPGVFKKTKLAFEVPKDIKPILIANKNKGSTDYVEFMLS